MYLFLWAPLGAQGVTFSVCPFVLQLSSTKNYQALLNFISLSQIFLRSLSGLPFLGSLFQHS